MATAIHRNLNPTAWVGLALIVLVVCIAWGGPIVAPYDPDAIFGRSFAPATAQHILGLDFLGRDVLSRFLNGGRTAVLLAFLGNTAGSAGGIMIGVTAAYYGGWTDQLLSRAIDVALAFPGLVLALLLLAAFGTGQMLIMIAIAVTIAPGVARITRAAALGVVKLPYIEAAQARGDSTLRIAVFEILPNILNLLIVDYGMRMTSAILLVSALGFLGMGLQPPSSDWGLIVGENRLALLIQPWPVLVPVAAISLLTIGINLAIDGYRRDSRSTFDVEVSRVG